MRSQGLRERLTLRCAAPGRPFDNGLFEITEEDFSAPWPSDDLLRFEASKVNWEGWNDPWPPPGNPAPRGTVGMAPRLGEAATGATASTFPRSPWPDANAFLYELLRAKALLDDEERKAALGHVSTSGA